MEKIRDTKARRHTEKHNTIAEVLPYSYCFKCKCVKLYEQKA